MLDQLIGLQSSPAATSPERRRNPRTPLENLAYIHMEPDSGAIVLNVSEGGLGFHAVAPVVQTGAIRLWLSLRSNERVEAVGELAWTDETRKTGGLRFTSLSQGALDQIRRWVGQAAEPAPCIDKTASPLAVLELGSPADVVLANAVTATADLPLPSQPPPVVHAVDVAKSDVTESAAMPSAAPSFQNEGVPDIPFFAPSAARVDVPGVVAPSLFHQTLFHPVVVPEDVAAASQPRFARGFAAGFLVSIVLVAGFLGFGYRHQLNDLLGKFSSTGLKSEAQSESFPPPPPPASGPSVVVPVPATPPELSATGPSGPGSNASRLVGPAATKLSRGVASEPFTDRGVGARPLTTPVTHAAESLVKTQVDDNSEADILAAERYLQAGDNNKNTAAAVDFLWAAIEKGNSTAEIMLADLYIRGDGVKQNCAQARVLLIAAAEKGNVDAQQKLQDLNGNGCF